MDQEKRLISWDPELPEEQARWGPLVLLLLGALAAFTPLSYFFQWFVSIPFHELGHALCAWLDSRKATPLGALIPVFAWTSFEEPSLWVGLLIFFLLAQGLLRSYWSHSFFLVVTFCLLLFLWALLSFFVGHERSQMWIVWAGQGGEFILSTWVLLGFYFYFPKKWHWPFFRWVLGFAGSFGLLFSCRKWFGVALFGEPLPLGTVWGGSEDSGGDLNQLIGHYLWTPRQIGFSYTRLAFACFAVLICAHVAVLLKNRSED